MLIPYVIEQSNNGERSYDIYSRLLLDRIVMIQGEVTAESMNVAVAQLLFLNNADKEKPIFIYLNTPGGSVVDGQALIDTMNFISAPVYTVALGMAASMGGAILAAGEKGHRYCMRSSQILVHPMSGGTGQSRTRDGVISMNYEKKLEQYLIANIAYNCGHLSKEAHDEIEKAIGKLSIKDKNMVIKYSDSTQKELDEFNELYDYDHWMMADEALDFGIVDKILTSEKELSEAE